MIVETLLVDGFLFNHCWVGLLSIRVHNNKSLCGCLNPMIIPLGGNMGKIMDMMCLDMHGDGYSKLEIDENSETSRPSPSLEVTIWIGSGIGPFLSTYFQF